MKRARNHLRALISLWSIPSGIPAYLSAAFDFSLFKKIRLNTG